MKAPSVIGVAIVVVLASALGCHDLVSPPPPPPALNDTPEGAIRRFIWAYENKRSTEYAQLFTEDFTFEFSTSADPTLAQQYQNGWFKTDEDTAARHLFEGFADDSTGYHGPASSIDLTLAKTQPTDDTEGKDPTKFKVLATRVDGLVVVPPTDGQTEETRYVIDNNFHRFFLVRGDAALDGHDNPTVLPPLAADSTRWYIYRWIDETVIQAGAPAGASSRASTASTWGSVKARYR